MRTKNLNSLQMGLCVLVILAITLSFLGGCGSGDSKVYKIGISQIVTHPGLDNIRQGVIDGLADAGYVEGKNVEFDYQTAEGDMSMVTSIAQKFVTDQVDAIVSIATPDSQASVKAAKGTGIPVVFAAVTDPVGAGLVSDWNQHREENVSGVSDMVVVQDDVDLILTILPATKKLGTIYTPAEANSIFLNEKFLEVCGNRGIEVFKATVNSRSEVAAAAQSLVGKVDAIWIGTDNTVISNLETIIQICEENDLPLFPSEESSVKRGGIAAYGFNEYAIGVQTGKLLARVLEAGGANGFPVEKGETIRLLINTAAAERMGVTLPPDLIKSADVVYK